MTFCSGLVERRTTEKDRYISYTSYFVPETVHLIPSEPTLRLLKLLFVWHQYFLDSSAILTLTLFLQANMKIDAF